MKTLVLLSGGIDSAVVLAMLRGQEREAIWFDYGQENGPIELDCATKIAESEGILLHTQSLPTLEASDGVVIAGRNAVLLSIATSIALIRGCNRVGIGANATDAPRFPDCRVAFIQAMDHVLSFYDISIYSPLVSWSKLEVVDEARRLSVPLDRTWSCYHPQEGKPCGKCLACTVRAEAGA